MIGNNLKIIQGLIDELTNLDFAQKAHLDSLFQRIQNSLLSIYEAEHPFCNTIIKIARKEFVPQLSTSITEFKANESNCWNTGKTNLIYSLKSVENELKNKIYQINSSDFIDITLIERLKLKATANFSKDKLIRYCEELNYNYRAGNYLASTIIARAILNYVPPIFGQNTFPNIVTNYNINRNTRKNDNLETLQQGLRKIGDLHNHDVIKQNDIVPTKNQIEPYKPQFEYLIIEIISIIN